MNLYFVENTSEGNSDEQHKAMSKRFKFTDVASADAIYCGSISVMDQAMSAARSSHKPLIVYCWDYYKWAHEGRHPGSGDWKGYARLLKEAALVIVPSIAQQLRLKELLGIDSVVVRTGIKKYHSRTWDARFILDPVRYYPDENRTWAEEAAYELKIPIIHSEHRYAEAEFRNLVKSCTFMTCAYREASTGGLTLAEGLLLGKPSLVSNSPYMGARDYLGPYGFYFSYDSFEDLKWQMKLLWEKPRVVNPRAYDIMGLSFTRMAKELYSVCAPLKK